MGQNYKYRALNRSVEAREMRRFPDSRVTGEIVDCGSGDENTTSGTRMDPFGHLGGGEESFLA